MKAVEEDCGKGDGFGELTFGCLELHLHRCRCLISIQLQRPARCWGG